MNTELLRRLLDLSNYGQRRDIYILATDVDDVTALQSRGCDAKKRMTSRSHGPRYFRRLFAPLSRIFAPAGVILFLSKSFLVVLYNRAIVAERVGEERYDK